MLGCKDGFLAIFPPHRIVFFCFFFTYVLSTRNTHPNVNQPKQTHPNVNQPKQACVASVHKAARLKKQYRKKKHQCLVLVHFPLAQVEATEDGYYHDVMLSHTPVQNFPRILFSCFKPLTIQGGVFVGLRVSRGRPQAWRPHPGDPPRISPYASQTPALR